MPSLDWSVNILGYPAHTRSAAPVIAVSHMATHEALRFAEAVGLFTGWIITESPQPQLEGLLEGEPSWVSLAELFAERRVAKTEGVTSGTVVFAATVPADGDPPADRTLITWAEELGRPWLLVVDNECTYLGNLNDIMTDALLRWFCTRFPLEQRWQETRFDTRLARGLVTGLYEHGWTRNLTLVEPGTFARQELWAGLQNRSILEHPPTHGLASLQSGLRLTLRGTTWTSQPINDHECPIDQELGRVVQSPL